MTDSRSEMERLADQEKQAHDEIHRAQRAERIMSDELFQEAVEAVKGRIWDEFAKTPISDDEARRNARISLHVLDGVLSHLRHHMNTGKLAKQSLSQITKRKDWLAGLKERFVA